MPYPGTIDAITFGQMGSVYTDSTTTTVRAAAGKVISAITFLEDTTFTTLTSKDASICFNTVTASGQNGEILGSDQVFPRGLTIYGRFGELRLNSGAVIAYQGV